MQISIPDELKSKSEDEVGYIGGNAATLVVKVDKAALEGRDLSGALFKGTDFSNARLQSVNFTEANLVSCAFTQALDAIFSVAFSPDGKLLATGDGNGIVRLL